ncbi:hypothetical protein EG103P2_00006 [Enterococcus phage EG103P2]|nr:hypothetical protein EG103P2_00006 [Enterococcus phage EG103P2]
MTEFKVGDKVRYFQDLSERYSISSPDVPIGAIGEARKVDSNRWEEAPIVMVEFEQGEVIWFYADELQLVDEETDLPFIPQVTNKTVLDTSLDINLDVYLAALSNMTTARKQMADLSLDRYLPEAVREALEERLDNKIQESGKQAEEAIARMSKLLGVDVK